MITSKPTTPEYASGWDRIFGKKPVLVQVEAPVAPVAQVKPKSAPPVVKQVEAPAVDPKAAQRMEYVKEWWTFCEKNSKRLKTIPQFEEFMSGKYEFNDEGNTPD